MLGYEFKQNNDFSHLILPIVGSHQLRLSLQKVYVDLHVDYVFCRLEMFVGEPKAIL